jgi:hypothetical protein
MGNAVFVVDSRANGNRNNLPVRVGSHLLAILLDAASGSEGMNSNDQWEEDKKLNCKGMLADAWNKRN